MSTASLSLIDAVGEHFIYSPSSPLFPVVHTSFEHHTLCEDCGCTPCIVSYLPDIAQEDIAAEELSQCLRFPYVSLFGVWVKYVCGFATRFPSLTVPTTKWSGALKNAIAYINGVVLPAIHGVHRLFGYHFPNEFCNYWGKDKSEVTDLDELVHWSHWNYADFVDECQTKQYCYGELCVLLVRNIYFLDTESPKVRLPITKWISFVETMRKVGTFQVLLQLVEKAKLLLPVSANSLSMREIDQYPQCIAHIGHLNYCGVSGTIPIHINVIVAPWQIRGYAPFEGDLEISKAFSRCIRMMEPWVRKLSVSNVWYFAPYALALDSGTRTYDAECLDCIITASTMYRDAQDYDMRSILGWRGFLAYRYPVEDAYPAGIVTHWLSAMASEETAIDHISMDGVWKCLHRPDEDFDFGSYVALREGLGRISLDNTVQVRMMTPSGVMTRGGAKAIQEALCTPTTGCCCQDRGPACNSMGVMLR